MQLYPENNSPELYFTNEDKLFVYSKGTVLAICFPSNLLDVIFVYLHCVQWLTLLCDC